jgi:hypothetical protein
VSINSLLHESFERVADESKQNVDDVLLSIRDEYALKNVKDSFNRVA